jgi:hypothetical protein
MMVTVTVIMTVTVIGIVSVTADVTVIVTGTAASRYLVPMETLLES